MDPWHLLWIIPLAASAGAFCMALLAGGCCDPEWHNAETKKEDT